VFISFLGEFKGKFTFAQLHFHFGSRSNKGSEHKVNGKPYPMELHFVHYISKHESIADALHDAKPNSLAVLGVLFSLSKRDNPHLRPIVSTLRNLKRAGKRIQMKGSINLYRLIPKNKNFYSYQGSLTTPPCAEVVLWNVFSTPIPISERQLKAFRRLKTHEGQPIDDNFRPVQILGKREVVFYRNVHARNE